MKNKRTIYLLYTTLSFLGISVILFIIFSRLLAYFQTPEALPVQLAFDNGIENFYRPVTTWNPLTNEGRQMEEHTLKKITDDYAAAHYYHNLYINTNRTIGLKDYYTKKERAKALAIANSLREASQRFESTTLRHELDLQLYAEDGTLIVFRDTQINYTQFYHNDQFTHAVYDTANFDVMMLLEDNFWRIRHKVRSVGETNESAKDSASMFVEIKNGQFYVDSAAWTSRGINYYPASYPWDRFWAHFDMDVLTKDFRLIRSASFNTIRIFVPYEQFGGPDVDADHLAKLSELLDLAHRHQLKVIVTLFDFFLGYGVDQWTLSERHAQVIVTALANHPAILVWDIKNEPDLDFENHQQHRVMEWLAFMAQRIKQYAPRQLVTVGWSTPKYLTALADHIDIYAFHYYEEPSKLKQTLNRSFDKPVLLEETGQHSFNAWWYPFRKSEEDQAAYTKAMLDIIETYDISYTWWTLYDFKKIPDNVVGKVTWRKGIQKNFGLIRSERRKKEAFHLLKQFNTRTVKSD